MTATRHGVTHLHNAHLCSTLAGRKQLDPPSRHFTDDFSNLGEFIVGFTKHLLLKDGSVPSLFGSAGSNESQTESMINNGCLYFLSSIQNIELVGSHITLQPKIDCPLKLSRAEPGQYLDGRPPGKTRLLLEDVLVRPAGGAHPVVCVGPNALV